MSISEIAHTLGFESLTYFERMFKHYMTLSPLKYRKTLNTVTYTNHFVSTDPADPQSLEQSQHIRQPHGQTRNKGNQEKSCYNYKEERYQFFHYILNRKMGSTASYK